MSEEVQQTVPQPTAPVQQPVAPQPQPQPQQLAPEQPAPAPQPQAQSEDLDVNKLISDIEAETRQKEEELKNKIMSEAESKFKKEIEGQKEQTNKVISELKQQIDALNKAKDEQVNKIVEDYKEKLSSQAKQIQDIEGELSQRQTNIPMQNNPYRQQKSQNDDSHLTQEQKLAKFYASLHGREFDTFENQNK